ncbi:c-type cytochrome [Paracoccus sanguinis]|uniref:Cytochrome c n=2 Tax=Paracoccus sanguinis TaxID=1545044 RepID=A0A1H2RHC9_9RHOB|nr:c-type cytochrome [Paracoccus sanguinis]QJD17701.1 cytochrome c [Paracoccus sanguinis]SDW18893.1 Cytochrome c [Paracoccus sanguinis]
MMFARPTLAAMGAALLLTGCVPEAEAPRPTGPAAAQAAQGAADYARYCVACHGPTGRGDGPAAAGLSPRPTDLTQLARRNGGTFPRLRVMARIDGYTMGKTDSPMPQFGEEIGRGPKVMFDAGDGLRVPTPARLVALQGYVETLQR